MFIHVSPEIAWLQLVRSKTFTFRDDACYNGAPNLKDMLSDRRERQIVNMKESSLAFAWELTWTADLWTLMLVSVVTPEKNLMDFNYLLSKKKKKITACNKLIMKPDKNDVMVNMQMSIRNIQWEGWYCFFAIRWSNLVITNCKTKLQKSLFTVSFLWRHLNSFYLTPLLATTSHSTRVSQTLRRSTPVCHERDWSVPRKYQSLTKISWNVWSILRCLAFKLLILT